MDLISRLERLTPGTVIPKPEARSEIRIKGWGKRRGEKAPIYFIPKNSRNGDYPSRGEAQGSYQQGVTSGEWEQAFRQLHATGSFTHKWFVARMPRCADEGSCNFTTIGGLLSLLGLAACDRGGVYRKSV
jgi:hypothetical protein